MKRPEVLTGDITQLDVDAIAYADIYERLNR